MNIADLLGLEECSLVEPSFSDLTDQVYTEVLLQTDAIEGRLLVDEEEYPLALALHDGRAWRATTFLFRQPSYEAIDAFDQLDGDIYQEEREDWVSAIRDHYSRIICKEVSPAPEDLRHDRMDKVMDLLSEVWNGKTDTTCIDACCGSGVGAAAIRLTGMKPVSYDNDPALLALGLTAGRLHPAETMCIDGTCATRYLGPAPLGTIFMAGEIHSYNAQLWHEIITELLALTDETLITAGSREECMLVSEWCRESGRETSVFENERDPIYDRWCCLAAN